MLLYQKSTSWLWLNLKNPELVRFFEFTTHPLYVMSLKKLNLAGWANCGAFKGAKRALEGLTTIFPSRFTVTITECK